jgi:hypothetical protein
MIKDIKIDTKTTHPSNNAAITTLLLLVETITTPTTKEDQGSTRNIQMSNNDNDIQKEETDNMIRDQTHVMMNKKDAIATCKETEETEKTEENYCMKNSNSKPSQKDQYKAKPIKNLVLILKEMSGLMKDN